MEEKKLSKQELDELKAIQVPEDPRVKYKFVNLYNTIHQSHDGEYFYEKEKYNFIRIISSSDDLMKCTPFSIYGVFLDVAVSGITLDQTGQPLAYILFYNQKIDNRWEKRAILEFSPYGELAIRIQKGQILYADSPVVVYEGDTFDPFINDKGQKIVAYKAKVPRTSKKIIGAFIRLTRPDQSFDFYWMLKDDISRLAGYSQKKNKQAGANALYTSNEGQIDVGFLKAKTIKHAFQTFPKLKIGQFSQVQKEEVQAIDYGLEDTRVETTQAPPPDNSAFGDTPADKPTPEPVTVNDQDDVF